MKKLTFNSLLILLVLVSALLGELWRLHGFLLLDLITPPLLLLWLGLKVHRKEKIRWPRAAFPAALFVSMGFASLLLHSTSLSNTDFFESAFYGLRWASLFGLYIEVKNQNLDEQSFTWKMLVGFAVLLATAGFVQLQTTPDFTAYENLGWDPHQGRLLSTWFDPNFVGAYLSFFTPILLGHAWDYKKNLHWTAPALAILVTALALTLSRSAYLSLFAGLIIFGFLRSIKLLVIGAIVLICLGLTVTPVQDRFQSLLDNISSVTTETYTLPDASARLRYDSWRVGYSLFMNSPLLGHGYNAYKFAALEEGLLKDTEIHAASGSDSSLLTVLATTGIIGFLPFISLYSLLLISAWKNRGNSSSLGFFSGLIGLLIHSIFVNSLLFPLLLAPFWITAGLKKTTDEALR